MKNALVVCTYLSLLGSLRTHVKIYLASIYHTGALMCQNSSAKSSAGFGSGIFLHDVVSYLVIAVC